MNNRLAVAIFAFDRPQHLARCLGSLIHCEEFDLCDLYIFVDGPTSEGGENVSQINDVIEVFQNECVCVHRSNENNGLANSIITGVTDLFNSYMEVIVVEDDLVLSRDFIRYMRLNLKAYKECRSVGSISGFGLDLGINSNKNYFHPRPCSWGWATWRDRWMAVDWKRNDFNPTGELKTTLRDMGQDILRMLSHYRKGIIGSWAIRWAYFHAENNWVSSYPFISRVKNEGFGDGATHCTGENIYPCVFIGDGNGDAELRNEVFVDQRLKSKFDWYYSNIRKLVIRFKALLLR